MLVRDRKGVDLDGRRGRKKLGGVEGGKSVIWIYYEKRNPFSVREK